MKQNEDGVNCGIQILNEEAMGSNPLKVPKFFPFNLQLFKWQLLLRRSYLHLNVVFPQFTSSSFYVPSIIAEYARYQEK